MPDPKSGLRSFPSKTLHTLRGGGGLTNADEKTHRNHPPLQAPSLPFGGSVRDIFHTPAPGRSQPSPTPGRHHRRHPAPTPKTRPPPNPGQRRPRQARLHHGPETPHHPHRKIPQRRPSPL